MALPALLAASFGANLIGSILGTSSERKRRKRLRAQLLAENAPLEALLRTRQFGPSESEGNIMQSVTQRTLSDLASRGILNSSISAPAVAQAVAPIENQRQQRTQDLLERVVAARQAILQGTELPGYGEAFGSSLGEAGSLLALIAGMKSRGTGGSEEYFSSSSGGSPLEPPRQTRRGPLLDEESFRDPYDFLRGDD